MSPSSLRGLIRLISRPLPQPPMSHFPKSQRLCSRKAIESLFGSGNRCLSAFPLRAVYRAVLNPQPASPAPQPPFPSPQLPTSDPRPSTTASRPSTLPCQVLFSVSKRRFKHAVDRNRAKRQMREAWRLSRHILAPLNHPLSSLPSQPSTVPSPPLNPQPSATSLPLGVGSDTVAATPAPPSLHLAFLWLSDTPLPSSLVHRKMKNLLHRIQEDLESKPF